jgi:hypothetical protein
MQTKFQLQLKPTVTQPMPPTQAKIPIKPKLVAKAAMKTNKVNYSYTDNRGINEVSLQKFKTADETDEYVVELLKQSGLFQDVEKVTYLGGKYNIHYRNLNTSELRAMQCRTLGENSNRPDTWKMTVQSEYDPMALIVGVNPAHTRFCLIYYKDTESVQTLSLSFGSTDTKYEKFKFTDIDSFKNNLFDMAKNSVVLENKNQGTNKHKIQESNSMDVLESQCLKYGYTYRRNNTLYSCVDILINNYKIQCKSSGAKHRQQYRFGFQKSVNSLHSPYSDKDEMDFFIFQIVKDGHEKDVCIVPKQIMIDNGFLKTDKDFGKVVLSMPPASATGSTHWSYPYWNRFDLLKSK